MTNITWRRALPPVDATVIAGLEKRLGVTFPADYIGIASQHHGGRPSPSYLDFGGKQDREFRSLLSLVGGTDKTYLVDAYGWIKDRLPPRVIPFANQSAGDYYCFDFRSESPTVVYWDHERAASDRERALTTVAPSFSALLGMLHEPAD